MFIYVTFDSNGFVTDYKKVETDGNPNELLAITSITAY